MRLFFRWDNLNHLIREADGQLVFGLNLDYPNFRAHDQLPIVKVLYPARHASREPLPCVHQLPFISRIACDCLG